MRLGIIGLPYVGKTTVFNALTRSQAKTGGFGAASSQPNLAVVRVPDPRLDRLTEMYHPKKTIYATVEYLDIAGFEQGSAKKGSESFLDPARKMDALIHVVRAFEDPEVLSVGETIDPLRDFNILETELILTDLIAVESRLEKIELGLKRGRKPENAFEEETLRLCKETLEEERPLRTLTLSEEQLNSVRGFGFLSQKPMLLVVNVGEDQIGKSYSNLAPELPVLEVCGKLEAELGQLEETEAAELMAEFGVLESSLHKMIRISYRLLGLIAFFTVGEDEVRAWTIHKGSTALVAAGAIHSDIQRGFIRAELVAYDDLIEHGTMVKAKEKGLVRLEGKEYIMKDGDIVNFRFAI